MIDVPKTEARAFEEPPLSWKPFRDIDGSTGAIFTCTNGHTGTLVSPSRPEDHHTIDDGGVVSPSVVCPEDGCGFHDHVRLVGWEAESGL